MIFRILCFLLFSLLLQSSQSIKVVRVTPKNDAQKKVIDYIENARDLKIEFWKHPNGVGSPVDMEVPDQDYTTFVSLMKDNKMSFTVQIEDVDRMVKEQQIPKARSASYDYHERYHNLNEIHDRLQQIANTKPSITRVFSLGNSYERRPMKAIEIKGRYRWNKPVFFWECGIHAREWISPATCMYSIEQMVSKYGEDSSVTDLLDKMDFIILPVFNVDGYAYTWRGKSSKYRMWRKNRRPYRGCIGTDLNRNWGHKWGGSGASAWPCDNTFRGSQPFSEVETSNVKSFLMSIKGRLKGFIDMHAYSQMWFIPWGYTSDDTQHHDEQFRVARIASSAIRNAGDRTRYTYGSSAALLYAAAGGSEDWVYGVLGVQYSFSVELRDTGRYGFLLPENQIIPTGIETFEGVKALVKAMNV